LVPTFGTHHLSLFSHTRDYGDLQRPSFKAKKLPHYQN
jgi:hypothetical protein